MSARPNVPANRLKFARYALAMIAAAFIGGGFGLLSVMVMAAVLYLFGGWEGAAKHGISQHQSCRLGGVILVVYPLCVLFIPWASSGDIHFSQEGVVLAALSLGIFALGLFEDLTSALSARVRLVFMLCGGAILVLCVPALVIQPLGIPLIDSLFRVPLLAYGLTVLALCFLPNAFNIADGANGLLSGICLLAIYGLMGFETALQIWPIEVLWTGCLIFFALNVVTGSLFLGDGGAYLLGLIVGITMILTANQSDVSAWYLAMLVFYPMTDFIFSIVRRTISGRPAMLADDEHFHNLLFRQYRRLVSSPEAANTLTGLTIALCWPGCFVLWNAFGGSEANWVAVYFINWVVFVVLWYLMRLSDQRKGAAIAVSSDT